MAEEAPADRGTSCAGRERYRAGRRVWGGPSIAGLTAYGLRCEHLVEPLGIGARHPRLAWRLRAEQPRAPAAAARVVVHSDADVVWDTGWAAGPAGRPWVDYGGPQLRSSTRYTWSVALRALGGTVTEPVESWFETALDKQAWRASWVSRDPEAAGPANPPTDDDILGAGELAHLYRRFPPPLYLRRRFRLDGAPSWARLYITAKGVYVPYLNGARVGTAELSPGWTDYRFRVLYQTYDVTDLLREGDNVLGAIVGDGWYSGRVGPGGRRLGEHYGSRPELIAQLHARVDDGTETVVTTDYAWEAAAGPPRYADLLAGEYHDARRDLGAWNEPADVSLSRRWKPVLVLGQDHDLLAPSADEPVRAVQELAPVAVDRVGDRHLIDLGQNMVGRVRLTLPSTTAGQVVTLRHGEMIAADGSLYVDNLRTASATDIHVAAGAPSETFEPMFTFHGFRHVEVTGAPAAEVRGIVLSSDLEPAGGVTTSDPTVNRLIDNIVWSQRGNFVSVPTDCPQRDERLGWLADAQVFVPTACFNAQVAAFFIRWLLDVVDGRDPDGAFPDVAPRLLLERVGAPGWGDGGVIVPWHLWRVYGDERILERCFPAMLGWIDHIHRHNPDLVWRHAVGNHYGDWLQMGVETPREVLATAYFAHSAGLVAAAAKVLGNTPVADRCRTLADEVRTVFQRLFVSVDGTITGETQTAYLLALAFDLVPTGSVGAAVEHLVADIERRDNRLTTGFLGVRHLLPVLCDHGHADIAYRLLHQTEPPSWGYQVSAGATTMWERWDGWTAEGGFQSSAMNSFNHYAFGSVGEWLYRYVAGIDQSEGSVAYQRVRIHPTPGGRLTSAAAWFESARGRIESAWSLGNGEIELTVTVPPGVERAEIEVPTRDPAAVTRPEGATDIGPGRFSVPAGAYTFRSPWR